jgi:hypothetical protein
LPLLSQLSCLLSRSAVCKPPVSKCNNAMVSFFSSIAGMYIRLSRCRWVRCVLYIWLDTHTFLHICETKQYWLLRLISYSCNCIRTRYQVLRVPGISFYMVRVYDAVYHRMHIAIAPHQWNILTSIRYYPVDTKIIK